MYLAIDPGETTGWAWFGPEGIARNLGDTGLKFSQVKGWEAFSDLLEAIPTPPRVVIYERFIIDDDIKKHVGEEHVTIQNIGILKAYARRNGAELVGQTNKILKLGYGWGQITPATQKKDSHRRDALAHGVFYLVKNNIREVRRM